jgi:hypothetical protein
MSSILKAACTAMEGTTAESSASNTAAQEDLPVLYFTTALTDYKMSRTVVTVRDAWQEYQYGLPGFSAVKDLEKEHETKWRSTNTETTFFTRRKVIFDKINSLIKGGMSENDAIISLERRRLSLKNSSLSKLVEEIKNKNKRKEN